MAKIPEQIIIIGGGIGGLRTALALRQIGIDVKVYERTEPPGEIECLHII